MAKFIQSGAVSGGSISATEDLSIKSIILTAGSADATLSILSAASAQINISAKAGETTQVIFPTGGNQYGCFHLTAPVTITTTGTGVWARLDY